jgi:hypothetical protein
VATQPIEIIENWGSTSLGEAASDILKLTKAELEYSRFLLPRTYHDRFCASRRRHLEARKGQGPGAALSVLCSTCAMTGILQFAQDMNPLIEVFPN